MDSKELRDLYLDLVQRCIVGLVHEDPEQIPLTGGQTGLKPFNLERRMAGHDWPSLAHSMAGMARIKNARQAVEWVLEKNIPGDFIETGVWRGGACIMMRAVLKAYGVTDRTVWVADSFEGLPPATWEQDLEEAKHDWSKYPQLAISLGQVQKHFANYGLLDDRVKFLRGWFKDTLPVAPIDKLAILRLDGDLYESTMDALRALYHKVSPGGVVIVDDFGAVQACRRAVVDFIAENGIEPPQAMPIDQSGIYWFKP